MQRECLIPAPKYKIPARTQGSISPISNFKKRVLAPKSIAANSKRFSRHNFLPCRVSPKRHHFRFPGSSHSLLLNVVYLLPFFLSRFFLFISGEPSGSSRMFSYSPMTFLPTQSQTRGCGACMAPLLPAALEKEWCCFL